MAEMLFEAHSGVRYLVLLAAVVALLATGMDLRAAVPGRTGAMTARLFAGLLDLQVLLGVLVLLVRPFQPRTIGHIVLMVLAAAAAHASAVFARRRAAERAAGIRLAGIALALLLIVAGILAIRDSVF